MAGSGTREDPWLLKTPPGSSDYQMYRDDADDPPALVCHRGRFGMYVPPLLEELGLAELSHEARNNKMRAL